MFGLWKKRKPGYPETSGWDVKTAQYQGKPMIVRVNASAEQLVGHPDYRYRVGIAIPLRDPADNGLPSSAENLLLNDIEDMVCAELERDKAGLHVLSIATQSMKEFVFYTKAPNEAARSYEGLKASVTSHELQCVIEQDASWGVYKQFAK